MTDRDYSGITGFSWDRGNTEKIWKKHRVSIDEVEVVFFNQPFFIYYDEVHSLDEERYYLLGETNEGRELFVVFTIRDNKIRVISARDMSRKERKAYEDLKENSEI